MYPGRQGSPRRDVGSHRDRDRDYDRHRERRSRSRSRSGDYSRSRSRSPRARRFDDRDGDYRRSRKDSPGPPRDLNYDDEDGAENTGADYHRRADRDHDRAPRGNRYDSNTGYGNDRWSYGQGRGSGRGRYDHDASSHGLEPRPERGWGDPRDRGDNTDPEAPVAHSQFSQPSRARAQYGARGDFHGHPGSGSARAYRYTDEMEHAALHQSADLCHDDERQLTASGHTRSSGHGHRGSEYPDHRHQGSSRHHHGSGKVLILEGLPEDATERDILYGLDYVTRDRYFSTDQVRLARLRHEHNGRRIAIVEFHRRSDAEHFYGRYYPTISFRLEHSRGLDSDPITVRVEVPRHRDDIDSTRETRRDGDDWECIKCRAINYPHRAVCFKCKTERPDGYDSGPVLTGETDECPQQTPSQYIVVRELEGSVTEEVLAKGVMKLFVENPEPPKETTAGTTTTKLKSTAPTNNTASLGARPGSLRRVFLMRDKKTNESWRYGFAEFATVEDAKGAVAKFRASPKFTISSKPVVVAFIHTGVFVPAFDMGPTENEAYSFTPIYNPNVRVKYWDDRAYPSAHVVSTEPLPGVPSPEKAEGDDTKSGTAAARPVKKTKKEKDAAPGSKIAMIPQMQLWAKASAELHGLKQGEGAESGADGALVSERDFLAGAVSGALREADQPDGPVTPQWGDQYQSYANWDSMTCLVCGWEAPTQEQIQEKGLPQTRGDLLIDHERRAHQLYKDPEVREKAAAALAALNKTPRTIVRRTPRLKSEQLPVYKSYADFDTLRCVLCRRVFKDARLIWLHEQQSELHKRMLASPENRARAAAEFKAMGKKMRILEPDAEFKKRWEQARGSVQIQLQPQYRDRALERRKAFGQPKQPTMTTSTIPEKRKEFASTSAAADDHEKDVPLAKKSKGAGILAKMGWTEGTGLGAEGSGRTEAIATEAYVPGVGLGAEGGKLGDATEEATRSLRGGFQAFVEKTREKARERFEKLGP